MDFWVGLQNPILGKGGRRGSGMVPFERGLVSSYRASIVTFPLSLRVSEILRLLCSSTPLFPTSPLVSPKFLHVPLGGWPLGYQEEVLMVCAANLCGPDPPTSQTDRRTDGRTDGQKTCDRNTALCTTLYSASRGKNAQHFKY